MTFRKGKGTLGDHEATPLLADKGEEDLECIIAPPHATSLIIGRIKNLITRLIPIEVEEESLISPTSQIINANVIGAFTAIAGDYADCLPYALLESRRLFARDALRNPTDYDENQSRKLACEVLARKVLSAIPSSRQHIILSTRFSRIASDGDETAHNSALELAVDQHAVYFLSGAEAQRTVVALWKGHLIQDLDARGHVVYRLWQNATKGSFLEHFDPARLGVPRYQNVFKIFLWIIFLIAFSFTLNTPQRGFGFEDIVLYIQMVGYILDGLTRSAKLGPSSTPVDLWTVANLCIWTLMTIALGYRIADVASDDPVKTQHFRTLSFRILSCAAPLVWLKILTIFDLQRFFGTSQLILWRMLKETGMFFILLVLIAVGFVQAMNGVDVSDNFNDQFEPMLHSLIQGLLGSPDFEPYGRNEPGYPFSIILYYLWNFLVTVLLLNILVALFNSAYSNVEDEAMNHFLTYFAGKTVSMVRAPDEYVFPAPFNLIEIVITPLEFIISTENYDRLSRGVMQVVFFVPLCLIAYYESRWQARRLRRHSMILDEPEDELPEDPELDVPGHDDDGVDVPVSAGNGEIEEGALADRAKRELKISRVPFAELLKQMPDIRQNLVMKELQDLTEEVSQLRKRVAGNSE